MCTAMLKAAILLTYDICCSVCSHKSIRVSKTIALREERGVSAFSFGSAVRARWFGRVTAAVSDFRVDDCQNISLAVRGGRSLEIYRGEASADCQASLLFRHVSYIAHQDMHEYITIHGKCATHPGACARQATLSCSMTSLRSHMI